MRPGREDALLELLLIGVCLLHVTICPYTKVEESFNLHAVHDILEKGISSGAVGHYDHIVFTGPLPRSFVGALTLATGSWPAYNLLKFTGFGGPLLRQLVIRWTLALSNSLCLVFVARRLRDVFNARAAKHFLTLSACQFHIPFWIGRTVPNMLAFGPAQLAMACMMLPKQRETRRWSRPDVLVGIAGLTCLSIILRLELVGLLLPLIIQAWYMDRLDWLEGGATLLSSALAALSVTLSIDSHFWRSSVWPELHSLLFNVVQGKSEAWGILPWHSYYTSMLPKLMLLAYPLALLGSIMHNNARQMCLPIYVYIAAMSVLRHKEWRFIVYTIPFLNVSALAGIRFIRRTINARLAHALFLMLCASSLFATIASTAVSYHNYPGGHAMTVMNHLLRQSSGIHSDNTTVHLDVYSRMTGATNLLHTAEKAKWDKDETLPRQASAYSAFTYLIVEDVQLHLSNRQPIAKITEWAGLQRNKPSLRISNIAHNLIACEFGQALKSAWLVFPVVPTLRDRLWIMQ